MSAAWVKHGAALVAASAGQALCAQVPSAAPTNAPSTLPKLVPDCERGGAEGEVVVCGRRSTNDRYRIPEGLRSEPFRGGTNAWTARQALVEEAARAERPGSNSPVGAGGQTGEREQMLRAWSIVCPKVEGSFWKHKCRSQ